MKIIKRAPSSVLQDDFDQLFDRVRYSPFWPFSMQRPTREATWEPTLDFSETQKEYVVKLEAPGMNRDDLDVSVDGNLLTLSGKRELHREEKGEDYLWEEREEGRFTRTLRLPSPVAEGKIDASYTDGVLTVRLPKAEPTPRSRITIK